MKKIVCLIDNLGSGGAQRQIANLAILLKQHQYDITFMTYQRNDFYKHMLADAEIPVACIETQNYLERIWKVCRALKISGADIVITFLETPGFLACVAKACGAKWKLITSERTSKGETFRGAKQKVYNWFERYADLKVCNSHNGMHLWEKHYPQYTDKLRVIYNQVLMPEMESNAHRDDEKTHIVVAASYQEVKNPLGVIDAISLLDEGERSRIKIDWYGKEYVSDGGTEIYEEALRRIENRRLSACIDLHSETKQIYQIMKDADVVGLFSTVEGLPNAICEAMLLGKPIVMTRVSDYEILTEGNGILCNPDAVSIAEALRRVMSLTAEERSLMGRCSYEKANRLFNQKENIKQWISVIEDVN